MTDFKTISENPDNSIVLFDGVCNFCNSTINFLIEKNKKKNIYFLPMQSENAGKIFKDSPLINDLSTIILFENGRYYYKSTAIFRLLKKLDGAWPSLYYIGIIIPRFIRDFGYGIIARNRYKWFGRKEVCRLPSPGDIERFI